MAAVAGAVSRTAAARARSRRRNIMKHPAKSNADWWHEGWAEAMGGAGRPVRGAAPPSRYACHLPRTLRYGRGRRLRDGRPSPGRFAATLSPAGRGEVVTARSVKGPLTRRAHALRPLPQRERWW